MSTTIINRRDDLRVVERIAATCDSRSATMINLSFTGARLVVCGPVGEEVFLSFNLGTHTIQIPAFVVWRQSAGLSTVIGVRFDRLTAYEARVLRGHVLGSYYRMNAA